MYQFTSDCLIGIREIDEEHQGLFRLINEIQELLEKPSDSENIDKDLVAKNLIVKLREYALTHFAHEEAYMEKIHDPELERQKKEHLQFAEKINSYQVDSITQEEGKQITAQLLEYLVRWLYRHILSSDMMIGKLAPVGENEDAFTFTDRYKTGIDFVDMEHRKLFEIIRETNRVIHAELLHDKYDEIARILEELRDYTILHFHDEEEYMERISYDMLDAQRRAHQAFVDRLNEIDMDDMDDHQQAYLEELIEFLLGWLSNHILKMDKLIPVQAEQDRE